MRNQRNLPHPDVHETSHLLQTLVGVTCNRKLLHQPVRNGACLRCALGQMQHHALRHRTQGAQCHEGLVANPNVAVPEFLDFLYELDHVWKGLKLERRDPELVS